MYDTCGQSFIAADGDHAKASTHMFEDTGVMVMPCHHDIPLFLANMWTPREKQFYAFALISTLLQLILKPWIVVFLYDIGFHLNLTLTNTYFSPTCRTRLDCR